MSLRRQMRSAGPLVSLWLAGAVVLFLAGVQDDASLRLLFTDPAYATGQPWYLGLISNLGILGWSVAVTAAVGGAWVAAQTNRPTAARFLIAGAAATAVLLFDDLFLIHSTWIPRLGVSKVLAQLMVVAPAIGWLAAFRGEMRRSRWLLVVAALFAFGISLVVDRVVAPSDGASLVIEDSGKFMGILAWALYFVLTVRDISRSTIAAAMRRAAEPDNASVSEFEQV